jgi:hypothetical protein
MRTRPKALLLLLTTALVSGGIAFASPASAEREGGPCTPVSYAPADDRNGWLVCDVDGRYVYGGDCPPGTVIMFYKPALSPYCVPPDFPLP